MEDFEKMAKDVAVIRELGLTNMLDRTAVIELLRIYGYEETHNYIKANKEKYKEILIKSGEY